jgi:hypothetical protein
MFIVNEDGNIPEKQALCAELGIEYRVLKRDPRPGLVRRSSTGMNMENTIPYRIDLAGGWLDQPYVSKHYPGAVITISIEPTIEFNERSGMATSTRRKAVELWGSRLPSGNYEMVAKMLFCYDNPPALKRYLARKMPSGSFFRVPINPGMPASTGHPRSNRSRMRRHCSLSSSPST